MTSPFSDDAIGGVAATSDVSAADLRTAAAAVQSTLAEYPGRTVDGLVYEWRQAFPHDPVLERTPDEWVLVVPERAWLDIRDRAGIGERAAEAVRALHETRADIGVEDASAAVDDVAGVDDDGTADVDGDGTDAADTGHVVLVVSRR